MVFTTIAAFIRSRGPDEFWRKRKIFKISAVNITFYISPEWDNVTNSPVINSISLVVDEIAIPSQFEMFIEL